MKSPLRFHVAAAFLAICIGSMAEAGMPTPLPSDIAKYLTLSDPARMRLDVISFFLVAIALSALAIQLLWNFVRRDFPRLPRLSYFKALGVLAIWGLLFLLVLTMISGARELMTPGAWKKNGLTYELSASEEPSEEPSTDTSSKTAP
jgi:hypothetical protein